MLKTLGALLAAILCMRCATAIHGRYQSVPVASVPPGASIAVACDRYRADAGVTPANVVLRRAGEGCSLTLTKPGYDQARVWFERVPSSARQRASAVRDRRRGRRRLQASAGED
jgi:hypothetical protein